MDALQIETANLRLLAWLPAHLLALLEGTPQYQHQSGLRVAEGLREFFVSGEVSPAWLAQLRASTEADPWLHGFAVTDRDQTMLIGSCGFKGPPGAHEEGVVEIAYGIAPPYQCRGYATEAAAALVAFALADTRVHRVRAHTQPTPNASTRVLAKCGFTCVGEVIDPEDGPVWRWERGRF